MPVILSLTSCILLLRLASEVPIQVPSFFNFRFHSFLVLFIVFSISGLEMFYLFSPTVSFYRFF